MKQTPLYEAHVAHGGKLVDFAGWAMPLQYSGVLDEYQAVRTTAGLFDVSHMGRIQVDGFPTFNESRPMMSIQSVPSIRNIL